MSQRSTSYTTAFIFLTSLFFLWGFITVLVDSLVPRIKDVFEMNYGRTILVQSAFFIAFFVVSLPAGVLLTKIGYKKGIVLDCVSWHVVVCYFILHQNTEILWCL